MLHRDEIIREIVAMLKQAGDRELRIARAFIRALTQGKSGGEDQA